MENATATDLAPRAEPTGGDSGGAAAEAPGPSGTLAAPAVSRGGWLGVVPGLVVGAVAAVWALDRRALWLDEAYTLGAIHQLRRTLPETHGTMGLYYLLLRAWTTVSESVWWMRSLSVLLALGALVVSVRLARRLVGARWAVVAGVLLGLAPLWVAYAREARSYALVMLLVAVSWLALDHGLADPGGRSRRWWWVHTAALAALPLAHGLALVQVLGQVGVVAAARPDRRTWMRLGRGLGGAVIATLGLVAVGGESVGDWVSPLSVEQLGFLVERAAGRSAPLSAAVVGAVLFGAAVAGRAAVRARTPLVRARALVPLAWGLVPIMALALVSVVRPSFIPRYAIGCVPGLVLLVVVGARALARRHVALGAVVVLVVAGAFVAERVDVHRAPEDGWRMAARVVAGGAEAGDTVLLARETTTRPAFEAAWRDVRPAAPVALVASDRALGDVWRFEPDETPSDQRWAEAASAGRLWVVGDQRRLELDRLPWLVEGRGGQPPSHREVARWEDADEGVVVVLLAPR